MVASPNLVRNNFLFWNYWRQRSKSAHLKLITDSDAYDEQSKLVAHYAILTAINHYFNFISTSVTHIRTIYCSNANMKYLATISLLLSAHASAKEGHLDLDLASKRSDQRATLQHRELGKSKSSKNNSKKGGIFHTSKASKSGGGGAKSSKGSANSNDKMAVKFDRAETSFPLILAENDFELDLDLKKEEVIAVNQQLRNNAGINTGGLAAFTVTAMAFFLN